MNTARVTTLTQVTRKRESQQRPLQLRLFKRIFRYARSHRATLYWVTALVVVRSIQLPLLAWWISRVIGGPITEGDYSGLLWGVVVFAGVTFSSDFVLYHRQHLARILGEAVVSDMRAEIFQHLQSLTMSFFTSTKIGRIISRFTSDAEAVREGIQNAVFVTLLNLGTLIVAAVLMVCLNQLLFLAVLAMSPVYFLTYQIFKRRLSSARRAVQESFSRVTANLAESVTGVHVTQGFVREDFNSQLFGYVVEEHAGNRMAVARASGQFSPLLEFFNQVVIAVILVVGGYLVLKPSAGTVSPETGAAVVITFYYLASSMLGPIASIGNQYNTALGSMAGAERVFGVLDRPPDFTDDPNAMVLPPMEGRVEFRNVCFEYEPGKPVLNGINHTAEPGQIVALVGHTGCGKTTMISLIARFYLPTTGELLIDGHNIRHIQAASLHKQMGIVLQTNFLFTGSVFDNMRVGNPDATDDQVVEAARRLDCLDLIEALPEGFRTAVGERGAGLSLGQRQLVCCTRAMLADPRILILDEATSSVDTMTEARIQNALSVLLEGRTSFVVAHRLSTIRHADVVLVLSHGRIVERGSHNDLLATGGIYANLYQQFIRSSKS